jgi:cell wall-associated NlpC family hydrolase
MDAQHRFVTHARLLLKTKWRHRGRTRSGVDCIGVIELSALEVGLPFPEYSRRYGREPWDDTLRKYMQSWCGNPLPLDEAHEGDIALIRWGESEPCHLGIVANHPTSGLSLIHATILHGVVEQGIRDRVKKSIIEVYRPNWSEVDVD